MRKGKGALGKSFFLPRKKREKKLAGEKVS
jgi:hypothetical protein